MKKIGKTESDFETVIRLIKEKLFPFWEKYEGQLSSITNKSQLEKWLTAQKRHHLSDMQVQMARELGLNPDKLGKINNHKQELWETPLPQFIEEIYFKRFKRDAPETVKSLRQILRQILRERNEKRE